jgi:hypothetical protein
MSLEVPENITFSGKERKKQLHKRKTPFPVLIPVLGIVTYCYMRHNAGESV